VRCITGGAGAGKTRLAVEACEAAEAKGWVAAFAPSAESPPAIPKAEARRLGIL